MDIETMKAVVCTALEGPSSLRILDWPSRPPQAGEVRITMHAAGVNFADTLVTAGRYHEEWVPPFVLGTEGAGIVVETGPDVTDVSVGDRVVIQNNVGRGCQAEEITIPAYRTAPVPHRMSLTEAAGVPINFGTAYYALARRAQVKPGEFVVVHGASGGVGLAAVQIAKMLGATVIATGGDDAKLAEVRQEGADHVINYRSGSLREEVLALTEGRGADVYYDPVGGDIFDTSLKAIAMYGRIVIIGFASGHIPSAAANRILFKGISVVGAPYGRFSRTDPTSWRAMMSTILDIISIGSLKVRVHEYFPLAAVRDALALIESRQVIGKCILLTERGFEERAGRT